MPTLQEHQQRVLDRLYADDAPHGLIAYHSTGSGKTLTALAALQKALADKNSSALMITPASLVQNVAKEQAKHGIDFPGTLDVMSYERARNLADHLAKKHYNMLVMDEAHRLRNSDTGLVQSLKPVIGNSDKVLMLTGTAGYNHPSNVSSLINLIEPSVKMPENSADFEHAFVDDATWKLKNKKALARVLGKYVDLYDTPKSSSAFPSIEREVVDVEMNSDQAKLYRQIMKGIPSTLLNKVRRNLPMSLRESHGLNTFSSGVRQISDSTGHHDIYRDPTDSPKLQEAARRMIERAKADKDFRGVAYSNFVDAGLNPYAKVLRSQGIDPMVFTGGVSGNEKKDILNRFNTLSGKPEVLLISSSGAEGLDLKGTRLLQILEPHFNQSKITQVEGRGARYMSHAHLPEDQRNLKIEEYHSTLPRTLWQRLTFRPASTGIDEYLANSAKKKQGIVDELKRITLEQQEKQWARNQQK